MDASSLQLCRICITNSNCVQMIPIFGEDSLWKKITLLADVQIERNDYLPQQVCITCAKNAISACLFKKKCEDADNFFRQQLLIRKIEGKNSTKACGSDIITLSEEEVVSDKEESSAEEILRHPSNERENDGNNDEVKMLSAGKPPSFDFNSIRLMQEYVQQHLSKINGVYSAGSGSEAHGEEDESLPLIPEIELLTPSEEINTSAGTANVGAGGEETRGYQCTVCFQIFEIKQILKHHMQSVHGSSGPVYECSNCKKTYFYKRFLEKHVRRGRCVKKRRNQTRPMQCSDCHVLFPTGHHLGWHKRTGCPSRAAKMPLQQLFKQNIVQYNNFPKRIGVRKPENAIYLHNRKLIMANNKRKGRTRIKLDAKKIALAKQLILREATTTVIANELNISRTFAWRLRKSLVNGVSLHERVIDPPSEDQVDIQDPQGEQPEQFQNGKDVCIKAERIDSYGEDGGFSENEHKIRGHGLLVDATQVHGKEQENKGDDNDDSSDDEDSDEHYDKTTSDEKKQLFFQQANGLQHKQPQGSGGNGGDTDGCKIAHIDTHYEAFAGTELSQELNFKSSLQHAIPVLNGYPTSAVSTISHQLPVNLSIKPITSLQSESTNPANQLKKPRKPNVFIDDEKYAMAKALVAQNSSTMEIARQLNVSQMTAWKVRDAIVKGIPLSYRSKREMRAVIQSDSPQLSTSPSLSPQHQQQLIQITQPIQQNTRQQNDAEPTARPPTTRATVGAPKTANPRRRLKAAEREQRDREVTREILEMIKEDSNIQYWKVSARLAEKGYSISPSSVCQKLKSMGIHRRWKPGDKPPMLDMEQLKASGLIGSVAGVDEGLEYNHSNEEQFDLGGAHFLSAFTR